MLCFVLFRVIFSFYALIFYSAFYSSNHLIFILSCVKGESLVPNQIYDNSIIFIYYFYYFNFHFFSKEEHIYCSLLSWMFFIIFLEKWLLDWDLMLSQQWM